MYDKRCPVECAKYCWVEKINETDADVEMPERPELSPPSELALERVVVPSLWDAMDNLQSRRTLFHAAQLWECEAGRRAANRQSILLCDDFCLLTEALIVFGDRIGISVPALWAFLCETTQDPSGLLPRDPRPKPWHTDLERPLRLAQGDVMRLQRYAMIASGEKDVWCEQMIADVLFRPDEGDSYPNLTQAQQNLVRAISEAGHRLTADEILGRLAVEGQIASEGTTKIYLAALVRMGILDNDPRAQPRGYGLCKWREQE